MTLYYPPRSFYYRVGFEAAAEPNEARFQSVSGLTVEYETDEFKEGGENRFVHKLPGRTRYPDLVLRRGLLQGSQTVRWLLDAFQNRVFTPRSVTVALLDDTGAPLTTWKVAHAVPKKWSVSDLNANENSVVVETVELSYQYFTVETNVLG